MKRAQTRTDWQILAHALLGVAVGYFPLLMPVWFGFIFGYYGLIRTAMTGNRNGEAHQAAAYLCGMEMIVRAVGGLPHEITKYSITALLMFGYLINSERREKPIWLMAYFLMLLPAILLVESPSFDRSRQLVSANLSGPLCLASCAVYFYRKKLTLDSVIRVFRLLLLPVVSTVAFLFIVTPSISEIEFTNAANDQASGYGPNQMASMLGLALLLIGVSYLLRKQLIRSLPLAALVASLVLYRGLLTFSRGGLVGPLLLLALLLLIFIISRPSYPKQVVYTLFALSIMFAAGTVVFNYINEASDNKLVRRYTGAFEQKKYDQRTLKRVTSGRSEIFLIDLEIFSDYLLTGIGPGMGTTKRIDYGYKVMVAAHIEFTRLLAEHGILGLFALLILLLSPVALYFSGISFEHKVLILTCCGFCFLTMAHSAMRIAAPAFMYGLAFIKLIPASHGFLHRQ